MPPRKPAGERYGAPVPKPPPPDPRQTPPMDYQGGLDETGRFVWAGTYWRRFGRAPFAAGFQGCFGASSAVFLLLIVVLWLLTHH